MPATQMQRPTTAHVGWLRASVAGANDGILSTAAWCAHATHGNVMVAGTMAEPLPAALTEGEEAHLYFSTTTKVMSSVCSIP
jgi:hypothetical protein